VLTVGKSSASRLDYCNSALFGCKTSVILRLQSIQNSSARLILNIPRFGRITTAMRDTLHLLPVPQRITFNICMLVRNCVNGSAPIYLEEICNLVSADVHRPRLRSTDHGNLVVPRTQHWQIRSARLFCVRAEPVEQAAT